MTGAWAEIKVLLSLAFVVSLAYIAMRALGRKSALVSPGVGAVQNVGAVPLAPGKSLQVVVVDRRTVLILGVAAHVECVARFDDPDLAEKLLAEAVRTRFAFLPGALSARWRTGRTVRPGGFADLLRERLLTGEGRQGGGDVPASGMADKGPDGDRTSGSERDPDAGGDGR